MKRRLAAATIVAAVTLFSSSDSEAAPPFVTRPMTLPRHDFAGDVGLGVGHERAGPGPFNNGLTGAGLNLEGAFGITETVELGLRTGVRFGDEGRFTQADYYGRTLWTETYGTGFGAVANPEARVRWNFFSGDVVEIGLDWRVYLPFEEGTRFGGMFGVPFHFHVGNFMRIDTGPYLPTIFRDPAVVALTVPGYFWFQVSEAVWLGPMVSSRFRLAPNGGDRVSFLAGFGLGVQVHRAVDLKTMILFPTLGDDAGARNWGAGFGVQFRIE
jgi:hypothetical protein